MYQQMFRRDEKKYLLSAAQKSKLMNRISAQIQPDEFFESTICSLYFDTPTQDLIIQSISKPVYKQKVRLRSYNVPSLEDEVFLEVKNKFRGIVSKRRFKIKLADFYAYYEKLTSAREHHERLTNAQSARGRDVKLDKPQNAREYYEKDAILRSSDHAQIAKELDYLFRYYALQPNWLVCYDRKSYRGRAEPSLRITFDQNLRSRRDQLRLELGDGGEAYFSEKMYVMEIKALDAIPLWLTRALTELKIYPVSFTKYGNIYKKAKKGELC